MPVADDSQPKPRKADRNNRETPLYDVNAPPQTALTDLEGNSYVILDAGVPHQGIGEGAVAVIKYHEWDKNIDIKEQKKFLEKHPPTTHNEEVSFEDLMGKAPPGSESQPFQTTYFFQDKLKSDGLGFVLSMGVGETRMVWWRMQAIEVELVEWITKPTKNAKITSKKFGVPVVTQVKGTGKTANYYDRIKFRALKWKSSEKKILSKTIGGDCEEQADNLCDVLENMAEGETAWAWTTSDSGEEVAWHVEVLDIEANERPKVAVPIDVAAPPPDATKVNGVFIKKLSRGNTTISPNAADTVKVHYTGWTTKGRQFDSSVDRGSPASFPLNRVIPGWTEGLQQLNVGDKARLWIPEELAYKGNPGSPQGMLVFDVELLEVVVAPKPPTRPKHYKKAPRNAKRTKSGLRYLRLKKGKGPRPTADSYVTVHYSMWDQTGTLADSSVVRGRPAKFGLNQVIKGWTEAVQLMRPGSKYRFWIPEKLAYEGRDGPKKGMLTFDIELISFAK